MYVVSAFTQEDCICYNNCDLVCVNHNAMDQGQDKHTLSLLNAII